ncbi:hypothetical protein OGAPHI_005740 [Ogataea philodendri]|uniref:Uncharacterized protein n=1 Tax=Ogataea philodendri TaxID=1378263 RepID=A0A9P8NYZ0_9ASCO|nr:uncharacterized protein OGAPHI_005740 [Ogataea philodendri]KAH3662488.1 hypothetical protein OGAPHI_005740 [Ogataea philodendri]
MIWFSRARRTRRRMVSWSSQTPSESTISSCHRFSDAGLVAANRSSDVSTSFRTSVRVCSNVKLRNTFAPASALNCDSNGCTTLVVSPNFTTDSWPDSNWVRALETSAIDWNAISTALDSAIDFESSTEIMIWYCLLLGFVLRIQILSLRNCDAMYGMIFFMLSRFPVL